MKPLLVTLALAAATVGPVRAELYRPSVVRDTTIVGAVAGALIGGHNGDRWAEGALIGAAAGALVGTAVDHSRPVVYRERTIQSVVVVPNAPVVVAHPPPAPRVVVVHPAPSPRVVYVERHVPAVVVRRPVVYVTPRGHYHSHHHHRHHSHRRW